MYKPGDRVEYQGYSGWFVGANGLGSAYVMFDGTPPTDVPRGLRSQTPLVPMNKLRPEL